MNSTSGYGTGMAFSILAIVAGAIMYWAITAPTHGFKLATVGIVLMVAGAVGLLISGVLFGTSRNGNRRSTYDQQTVDEQGRETVVHQEVR
jgi:lipoprotein signal peptidase